MRGPTRRRSLDSEGRNHSGEVGFQGTGNRPRLFPRDHSTVIDSPVAEPRLRRALRFPAGDGKEPIPTADGQ